MLMRHSGLGGITIYILITSFCKYSLGKKKKQTKTNNNKKTFQVLE